MGKAGAAAQVGGAVGEGAAGAAGGARQSLLPGERTPARPGCGRAAGEGGGEEEEDADKAVERAVVVALRQLPREQCRLARK